MFAKGKEVQLYYKCYKMKFQSMNGLKKMDYITKIFARLQKKIL